MGRLCPVVPGSPIHIDTPIQNWIRSTPPSAEALAQTVNGFHALIRGERRGPIAVIARVGLWLARWPYGVGVWYRNWRYDARPERAIRVPVPVVCVGNLTLGGTGKTVVAEYVSRFYADAGQSVALLSRGYGATNNGPNDEAMLLEENLPDVPHLQGADRAALANTAIEELECDILVLDDGFQHRRLHRDLNIVLIDLSRPLADEYLFPRGLLREPVSSLKRADFVLFTRCDEVSDEDVQRQVSWITGRFPNLSTAQTIHKPMELIGPDRLRADLSELAGKSVACFCGIGNPSSFERKLAACGATVISRRIYPDHHPYLRADVEELRNWATTQPPGTLIITTQKDWVKLRIGELGGRQLWALRVGLGFEAGEPEFQQTLNSVLPNLDDAVESTVVGV
jgi:tetraacyldisaccharide 4'-kinase